MSFDLTNKNISDTFQNLLQKTGSDNKLYDLEGNQITDLTIAGALHAQSYIVSQSTTVATSGSTIFGDSVDDTHKFIGQVSSSVVSASTFYFGDGTTQTTAGGGATGLWYDGTTYWSASQDIIVNGHITASGDISSSGTISTNTIEAPSDDITFKLGGANEFIMTENYFRPAAAGGASIGQDGKAFSDVVSQNANIQGNITASGNISGSSTSTFTGYFPDTNDDTDHYPLVVDSTKGTIETQNSLKVNPSTNLVTVGDIKATHITASGNISGSSTSTLSMGGQSVFGSHITASGNISASGEFIGSDINLTAGDNSTYQINGRNIASMLGEVAILGGAGNWEDIQIGRAVDQPKNIIMYGPVTASGDISSSGIIYSSQYHFGEGTGGNDYITAGAHEISHYVDGNKRLQIGPAASTNGITVTGEISSSLSYFMPSGKGITWGLDTDSKYSLYNRSTGGVQITSGSTDGTGLHIARISASNGEVRVGIGDSSEGLNQALTVKGDISGSDLLFIGKSDGPYISASVGSIEISGSGNGLIQVEGDISASGNLYVQGDSSLTGYTTIGKNVAGDTDGIHVLGDITASGNIQNWYDSITEYGLKIDGHISASNDIYLKNTQTITWNEGVQSTPSNPRMFIQAHNGRFNFVSASTEWLMGISQSQGDVFVGIGTGTTPKTSTLTAGGDIFASGSGNTGHITASGNISSSGTITGNSIVGTLTGQASSVENALTVDNATLQLDSGTTYDGDDARTISVKDGGIDSDALAADISVTTLTSTQITASGNISGSAASTGSFGLLQLEGSDFTSASLASAIAGGGGSTNAAGSDTQVQFNDGGTDFGGDAGFTYNKTTNAITAITQITASGTISASGTMYALGISASRISNADPDNNTFIDFEPNGDGMYFRAGNELMIAIYEQSQDRIEFGDGGDIDYRFKTNNDDQAVFIHGETDNVGIGTETPENKLQVTGDISASGQLFIQSGSSIGFDDTGSMSQRRGTFSVNYGSGTQLSGSLPGIGDGYGDIVKFGATEGLTAGYVYYLNSDGNWAAVNATDNTKGADELLAMSLGTNSDVDGMLLRGFCTTNAGGTSVIGAAIYVHTSDGLLSYTAPSSNNNIVRIVGHSVGVAGTKDTLYFNPSAVWVKVTA